MTPPTYRIAIVGSGTAGPAAAIFLARAGHEVVLYERAPKELPVGAGFMLQPTGLSVMRDLGLGQETLAFAQKIDKLFCRTQGGTTLLDLTYHDLDPDLFGLGTHRASLLHLLLETAKSSGTEILWDHEIVSSSQDQAGRHLLTSKRGERSAPFDLLLICDGAQSTLRATCGVPARIDRYPWGALWFIGQRTPDFDPHTLWQCVGSTRQLAGFLPTGTEDDLLSLFWSIRLDQVEQWKTQALTRWKEDLLHLVPQAEAFLNQIERHDQLSTAVYHDVRMHQWHGPRVAILGDAAHALSPQLGQGINLALMDAAALADCLARHPLDQALPAYSQGRKKHIRFYQFATRWCTPFFQSDHLALGTLRDLAFPLANRILWSRKQMTATMAGFKTGPFSTLV
jgi:2-polyprenyl-6-methoxyphenol hydroxylase-like FAD-dependent oxidoreductase